MFGGVFAGFGVGEEVADPFAGFFGDGGEGFAVVEAVGVDALSRGADEFGAGGVGDGVDAVVAVFEDEDVPGAVGAFGGVVVVERRLAAFGVEEIDGLLDQGAGVAGGVFGGEVVVVLVPAGAELEAVVGDHPAVLAAVLVFVVGIGEDVGNPADGFDGEHVGAVEVAGDVEAGHADVAAEPAGAVGAMGVGDAGAVGLVDEHVPLAVGAVGGAVVGEGGFAAEDAVHLEGAGDVGLGEGAGGVLLRGGVRVPAGAEDESVVADDPGVLDLGLSGGEVGELVVDPSAVVGGRAEHHESGGVAVGADDIFGGHADQVGIGVGDQRVLLVLIVDDEDVPLAIGGAGSVVVLDRGFAAVAVVAGDGGCDEGLSVGGFIGDVGRGGRGADRERVAGVPLAGRGRDREETGIGRVGRPLAAAEAGLGADLDSAAVGLPGLHAHVELA